MPRVFPRAKEYIVIEELTIDVNSITTLYERIHEHLLDGWRLYGGLVVTNFKDGGTVHYSYHQAMIKY